MLYYVIYVLICYSMLRVILCYYTLSRYIKRYNTLHNATIRVTLHYFICCDIYAQVLRCVTLRYVILQFTLRNNPYYIMLGRVQHDVLQYSILQNWS